MKGRVTTAIACLVFLLTFSQFLFPLASATVYGPGITPGTYMLYEVKHSPEIDGFRVMAREVANDTVTFDATISLVNGTLINQTLTLSIGKVQIQNVTKSVIPNNTTEGWTSIFGENTLALGEGYVMHTMARIAGQRFSSVSYQSHEPMNMSRASSLQFEISLDDRIVGERYFVSIEDAKGEVNTFEFTPSRVPDPRTQQYLLWEAQNIALPTSSSEAQTKVDYGRIRAIDFLYEGNSTRTVRLRNTQLVEPLEIGHSYSFYEIYPLYLIIAKNLEKGDQTFPDSSQVIMNEDKVVHQNTERKVVKAQTLYLGNGQLFAGAEYVWDRETGILVSSFFKASGQREVKLKETNAWAPPNLLAYIATLVTAIIPGAVADFWKVGGGITAALLLVWIGVFGTAVIYDKWRRNELGGFKQWLPFLYILIIASVVSFILLRVVPLGLG